MSYRWEFRPYRLAFRKPLRTSRGLWTERTGVIVRAESQDGRVGWGEAAPVPAFGMETEEALLEACRAYPGSERSGPPEVPPELPTLANAVRSAWTEASATGPGADRGTGSGEVPATGTQPTEERPTALKDPPYLPVAALLPAGRDGVRAAAQKIEAGFRAFKWKVGVGDARDEMGMMDDLLAALPAGARLRLDANGAWDRRRAEAWLDRCADRPVEFVEQPASPEERGAQDLLMGLAADFPTPIALDESLVGDGDLERWLGAGWPGIFVFKPTLFARAAEAAATLARFAPGRVVFSSAMETGVGACAALRLAFRWAGQGDGPKRALGFGVWPLFEQTLFDGPAAAPFVRSEDVERLNPEAIWNALS